MITICAVVIAVIAAVAAFIALRSSGEEFYRSVMVYELEGSAVIERADIGTIDAAENLYLESGDRVRVDEDSMMRLKLDNDKYITAEENTVFVLTAKGNEQDSETRIDLEQGAVINEIQNPLSENSTYETVTPNSVMAVRGTIYRAELCRDEDGNLVTKVYCFEGAVDMCAVSENSMSAPVIVEAGNEASVNSVDLTVSEVTPIDYMSFSQQTLEILNMMNIYTGVSAGTEDDDVDDAPSAEEQSDASGSGVTDEKGDADNADTKDAAVTPKNSNDTASTPDSRAKTGESVQPAAGTSQTDSAGGSTSSADSGSGDNQSENESDNGSEVKQDNPEPPKPKVYTVTFQYDGKTFATQKVKAGEKADPPALKPAQSVEWDFDFDKAINKNTTISWK